MKCAEPPGFAARAASSDRSCLSWTRDGREDLCGVRHGRVTRDHIPLVLPGYDMSSVVTDEFGKATGLSTRPVAPAADVTAAAESALQSLERAEGESPYAIHGELQTIMNDLVGLIRRE